VNWWQAVILGVVEGITEYLPISSTGHLIITSSLLGLEGSSVDAFNIIIQGGAIAAVLGLYRARVVQMIRGLLGRDQAGRRLLANLLIAFLPAAVLGVLLDDLISSYLFAVAPVVAALAAGGLWMIWLDRRYGTKHGGADRAPKGGWTDIEHLSWKRALFIGLFQCVAMWPGTSRSMMTIAGGMMCGLRPKHSAEFSFLLGLPTLGGACVYKLTKNLSADGPNLFEELGFMPVVIGFIAATITAALAVKWLVAYLTKHGLTAFGYYRLALCALLAGLAYAGIVTL
jgi:undecaprenyl-diphosphatase